MTLIGSISKRLLLVMILALWAVAFAMAQDGVFVSETDNRTYQVGNHAGSSYSWVIYNEPTFKTAASSTEVRMVSGENSPLLVVNWLKPGIYYPTVVETNQLGCTNTKATVVVVQPRDALWPVARVSNPTVLIGNTNYIFTNSCQSIVLDASSSSGDGLTFQWEPSTYLDNPKSSKPEFTPGITTNFQLTVTDIYGHSSTEIVRVMVAQAVKAEAGDNLYIGINKSGMLDGSKSSGENLTYAWKTSNGHFVEGNNSTHPIVDQPGKYVLTVTDRYGCMASDSVQVNIYTQAVQDTINSMINISADINVLTNDIPKIGLNPSTLKIVSPPMNGITEISADSIITYIPNQYFVGSDSFVYSICDYAQSCDEAKVLVFINDMPFFIPEAFSPNGDGINDEFEIKGLAKYKTIEIEIFNRWGNLVYQSKNYGKGQGKDGFWNGTASQGVRTGSGQVSSGTYFYVLKLDGKEKINGTIYLDR